MFDLARKLVPRTVKRAIRQRQEARARARLFGSLSALVPPTAAMFDGPASIEEFKANGDEFLSIYRDICGLRPDERMLDVGSGIGRKTIPLTGYLTEGEYEGIDVNALGVEWCQRQITPLFPNFRFQRIDVSNRLYNPTGTQSPTTLRFPFPDRSFTFITLGSVFTHMLPEHVAHYLGEIARVLGSGRCLISYFLLNDESREFIQSGKSTLKFRMTPDGYATTSLERPEEAIAFEESFVRGLYSQAGLRIARLEYGSWCGRREALSYQDLVLAVRE